jgi:hypothetical protein
MKVEKPFRSAPRQVRLVQAGREKERFPGSGVPSIKRKIERAFFPSRVRAPALVDPEDAGRPSPTLAPAP